MRGAALIFGLLAGLLGGGVIAVGNLESGLAASGWLGAHSGLLAKLIIYLIPNVGLLGAGLALARPRLGAFFLLLSAIGWAAVAVAAGHGAVVFAALPFTFAGAATLVALFARPKSTALAIRAPDPDDEESEIAKAALPRGRSSADRWQDPASASPLAATGRRPLRADVEPNFGTTRRRDEPVVAPPLAPAYEDDEPADDEYPAEEDYVDAEEAVDEGDEQPALYDGEFDEPPEDDDEVSRTEPPPVQPQRRQRPGARQWSLPEPDVAAPQPARRQNYAAERQQPPPQRRQAAPPPRQPAQRAPLPPEDEFEAPATDYAPAGRDYESRPRDNYRDFEPYQPPSRRKQRQNPLRRFLRTLILMIFILIVAGLAAGVYFDYERGPDSLLFGSRHQDTGDGSAVPSAAPPAVRAPVSPVSEAPAAVPETTAPARVADVAAAAPAAPTPLAQPAETPVAAPAGYTDPFVYCSAVGTIDAPDSGFSGSPVPHAVAAALNLPDAAPATLVRWRCANQAVLACNTKNGAACDLTPTVDVMISYCAAHPDAQAIPAPNGSWSCNGVRPVIPRDEKWPVDARGFYPDAWVPVTPPPAG